MLVAEFLASDEAEDLSDRRSASHCADHIVDYGCDRDFGRPLRMSPAKAETFLLDWLPRKVMLSPAEQDAMPHVLAAWARWAGRRRGLGDQAIGADARRGVRRDRAPSPRSTWTRLASAWTPGWWAAAARRRPGGAAPAGVRLPLLRGHYQGIDLGSLDPAQPARRRTLLAADHDDAHGRPATDQHIGGTWCSADRLWRGDPPELWEAAQRLLDRGENKHAVQHTLMYLIRDVGNDTAKLTAELDDLP